MRRRGRGPEGRAHAVPAATRLAALGLALGLALLAIGSGGCVVAQYREGNRVDLDQVDRIRPGTTTKAEVLDWFGPPENYTNASLIEELVAADEIPPGTTPPYRFSDVLAYQLHKGEVRGIFLFVFNSIQIDLRSDHLVVFFGEDDVVQYYGVRRADMP